MNTQSPSKILYLIVISFVILFLSGCSSLKPRPVGIINGRLHPCPPAPKCVSSYYAKGSHHIKPLNYTGTKEAAYNKIIHIIQQFENARIVKKDSSYIHAQFEVTVIKWVDNTEFLFDDENKIIHFASSPAAKIGYWDWGENRRRALRIHELFNMD